MPGHLNRDRIRDFLTAAGPVDDAGGQATAILRDAVSYEGSDVGFSQLLSAMEQRGEIVREIRGKRTYRIAAVDAEPAPVTAEPAGRGRRRERRSAGARSGPAASAAEITSDSVIDYEALAAALLDRVLAVVAARKPADQAVDALLGDLRQVTEERDQLRAQVHDFEDRLTRADRNTAILLRLMNPKSVPESRDDAASGPAGGNDMIEALLGALMQPEGTSRPDKSAQAS